MTDDGLNLDNGDSVLDEWADEVEQARQAAESFREEFGDINGIKSIGVGVQQRSEDTLPDRTIQVVVGGNVSFDEIPPAYEGYTVDITDTSI